MRKGHHEFCDVDGPCPAKGGTLSCGRMVVIRSDGAVGSVFCFGCNQKHDVGFE